MQLHTYPWTAWFSRQAFHLEKGDYSGMAHSFAQQIRNYACKHQVTVSIRIHPDGSIDVEVRKRNEPATGGKNVFDPQ